MNSWPDDGALVVRRKKANEARCTKFVFSDFTSRKLDFLICVFILFVHMVEIRRIADIHMHAIVASVLFKTQLLHDTGHFVQSSLGFDYSVRVSFSIVRFFFFLKYFWTVSFLGDTIFLRIKKRGSFKIVQLPQFSKKILESEVSKYDMYDNSFLSFD